MPETTFSYAGSELDALAEAENYYRMLIGYFAGHIGLHVVEAGAGIGTFAEYLRRETAATELTLVEPADNNWPHLQERFAGVPGVRAVHGYLGDLVGSVQADTVVSVNVMEHVLDDAAFLRDARSVLREGGTLLLFVPAVPQIFGTLDEAFDHYRRYTRSGLLGLLRGSGYQVVDVRYTNLPGVLSWFLMGRILRRRTIDRSSVRIYDRWVIPWLSRLERVWAPPVGQSLLAIARR